jgi:hypothetical protein
MTLAIYILAFLAILHFVYKSILAPSFRLTLRFQLFELRDEVRALKIECQGSLSDNHFDYLRDSINALICELYRFDAATLALAEHESRRDPEFRKRAEDRARILDDCDIPDARRIRSKSVEIATKALLVNSGASGLYLIPIALGFAGYSMLKHKIRIIASLSGPDFKRVSPMDPIAASPP